jgi:hypothetical protein
MLQQESISSDEYEECCGRILKDLQDKQALLVLDYRGLSELSLPNVELLLEKLLHVTKVKVIVIDPINNIPSLQGEIFELGSLSHELLAALPPFSVNVDGGRGLCCNFLSPLRCFLICLAETLVKEASSQPGALALHRLLSRHCQSFRMSQVLPNQIRWTWCHRLHQPRL